MKDVSRPHSTVPYVLEVRRISNVVTARDESCYVSGALWKCTHIIHCIESRCVLQTPFEHSSQVNLELEWPIFCKSHSM